MNNDIKIQELYTQAVNARANLGNLTTAFDSIHPVSLPFQPLLVQDKMSIKLTTEEREAIFDKLVKLFTDPGLLKTVEERLYLEQQLGDLTGLNVVYELNGYSLPHTTVKMQARSHQRTSFDDQVANHQPYSEALLEQKRSLFGWINSEKSPPTLPETYGLTLPLFILESWQKNQQITLEWFKYRKVLVINPFRKVAAIAQITDIGPAHLQRYQALCSPELGRVTQVWFPGNQGRACLFLLDQAEASEPGLINI